MRERDKKVGISDNISVGYGLRMWQQWAFFEHTKNYTSLPPPFQHFPRFHPHHRHSWTITSLGLLAQIFLTTWKETKQDSFLQAGWLPKEWSEKVAESQESVFPLTFDVILNNLYEVPVHLSTKETHLKSWYLYICFLNLLFSSLQKTLRKNKAFQSQLCDWMRTDTIQSQLP